MCLNIEKSFKIYNFLIEFHIFINFWINILNINENFIKIKRNICLNIENI